VRQTDDYIQRQIKGVAAMIARLIGLRLEGSPEEAKTTLEQAYGLLIGEKADFVRRLDPPTAAALLGTTERILLFARLQAEESALGGDATLKSRAAELARIAAARDPENEEARGLVSQLAQP